MAAGSVGNGSLGSEIMRVVGWSQATSWDERGIQSTPTHAARPTFAFYDFRA